MGDGRTQGNGKRHSVLTSPADSNATLTSFPEPPSQSPVLSFHEGNHDTLDSLLDRAGEPSMFDVRSPVTETDPQNLSAASPEVLKDVIRRHGASELVKRLSRLLAERDAHVTALQRLCDEYKVPKSHVIDASSRVKQAEQRRIALATAVSEENAELHVPISEDSLRPGTVRRTNSSVSVTKGITKIFGGVGRQRLSVQGHSRSASVRSTSRTSHTTANLQRDRSNDAKSVDDRSLDARSTDSGRWIPSLFSNPNNRDRAESRPSRVPVELRAQIDPDQLPPTLLRNHTDAQDIEWNRFILKLQRAREQNGEVEEEGMLIGAAKFGREGAVGRSKMETLAKLVVGGIPNRLRHALWMELSNAHAISQPNAYQYHLQMGIDQAHIDIDAIKKDVPRTLTQQYDYYVDKGYDKLKNLLIAFIAKHDDLGYTQGLNMIAGHLLLAIPADEDAFWMLCNIVDSFYPSDFFSRTSELAGPLADNIVLRYYIRELMPKVNEHLDSLGILPQNTLKLGWILTAFSDMLPREPLQRIWDVWLCLPKQQTFLFNVALALIKQQSNQILALENEEQYYEFVFKIPETTFDIDDLIRLAVSMRKRLDPDQIMERRKLEMRRMRNTSTEALYSPD